MKRPLGSLSWLDTKLNSQAFSSAERTRSTGKSSISQKRANCFWTLQFWEKLQFERPVEMAPPELREPAMIHPNLVFCNSGLQEPSLICLNWLGNIKFRICQIFWGLFREDYIEWLVGYSLGDVWHYNLINALIFVLCLKTEETLVIPITVISIYYLSRFKIRANFEVMKFDWLSESSKAGQIVR